MEKNFKKYIAYCVGIFGRSWGYIMKLLNINSFVRPAVVFGIIVFILWLFFPSSTSMLDYINDFLSRIELLGWVALIGAVLFIMFSIFVSPFVWVDELDGLSESLKTEKYSSPITNNGNYCVGMKILPNRPTTTYLYAVVEEAYIEFGNNVWKPYNSIKIGSKIKWIDTGHATNEEVAHIGRGDSGLLSLFEIRDRSAYLTLKNEDHQLWFATNYKFKISIYGSTSNGKDICPEHRMIQFSNVDLDFEILNTAHPTRVA